MRIGKIHKFHNLMPYRVREILLVASAYDAFVLEADGHLTERLSQHQEFSLASMPRFRYAASGKEALELVAVTPFDLILIVTALPDLELKAFSAGVKELHPKGLPTILLTPDAAELNHGADQMEQHLLDAVFLWTGDAMILLPIIKYIEDRLNAEHDTRVGVRVIIFLEDSPRFYSTFLAILYAELMEQSRSLASEGTEPIHRMMYMKSRPKVLHATNYEDGLKLFEEYQDRILAVISDVRLPRCSEANPESGLAFVRHVRGVNPEIPILLQSAEWENRARAEELGADFIDKNTLNISAEVNAFLRESLGFGPFQFRNREKGPVVESAYDVNELERKIRQVPLESLLFHGGRHNISQWLMARSEYTLAENLRKVNVSDFSDAEALRNYLVNLFRDHRRETRQGVVASFSAKRFRKHPFSRIGNGSMGGKARGIAFLNLTLAEKHFFNYEGLEIRLPHTVVITTSLFDEFMEDNRLADFAFGPMDDQALRERFLEARLPDSLDKNLKAILDFFKDPLAVRSSSLLEDSMTRPFAGIYDTLMISNADGSMQDRLYQLRRAIKLVYASAFTSDAKAYLENTGYRLEEEKMGIIIQPVIGKRFGDRWYPHFSGVAQSYNYYPIHPQTPEDGIAQVALGLGCTVVEGGRALRFCPKYPEVLPQFATPKSVLANSQREFFALSMGEEAVDCHKSRDKVRCYDLSVAEGDDTLWPVASVYHEGDRRLYDDLGIAGPRAITFNNILKHKGIPLAKTLHALLALVEEAMACPVEIEFACTLGDLGNLSRSSNKEEPSLCLLQVRPFVTIDKGEETKAYDLTGKQILCRTKDALGHGVFENIFDLIYVDPNRWEAACNQKIVAEVEALNRKLKEEGRHYVLVGPGRWGTRDPWLGIPVQWSQISRAKIIVEASPPGYNVEPSQGTHFFQNITALNVGYLTLAPDACESVDLSGAEFFDFAYLKHRKAREETNFLRHIRFKKPLTVVLDGRKGSGVIARG